MSVTSYTYSQASDFSDGINVDDLDEIITKSAIGTDFVGIVISGDVVNINFDVALDASGQTTLDDIVANYSYNSPSTQEQTIFTITPFSKKVISNDYMTVSIFNYVGRKSAQDINKFHFTTYMDSGITGHQIRIVDTTNRVVLHETSTFTNTNEYINIVNIVDKFFMPYSNAVIEFQMKNIGGDGILESHITFIELYYVQ